MLHSIVFVEVIWIVVFLLFLQISKVKQNEKTKKCL